MYGIKKQEDLGHMEIQQGNHTAQQVHVEHCSIYCCNIPTVRKTIMAVIHTVQAVAKFPQGT